MGAIDFDHPKSGDTFSLCDEKVTPKNPLTLNLSDRPPDCLPPESIL
jgi:hypothetical protein